MPVRRHHTSPSRSARTLVQLLVVVLVRRVGYDRRGWALQTGIAAGVVIGCRLFTAPAANINFAFIDPIFGRAFEPAATGYRLPGHVDQLARTLEAQIAAIG